MLSGLLVGLSTSVFGLELESRENSMALVAL
jgi:hypothetical protein